MSLLDARKLLGKKIIGITCHNSLKLAKVAIKDGADYIAFGAFFSTKTKKVNYKANIRILKKLKMSKNIPIVAIGGINNLNFKKLFIEQCRLFSYLRVHLE